MALNPTTELEAVNEILATIGEAPVASVDSTQADVEIALAALRASQREVLSQRWRFNTEFGYTISPNASGLFIVPSNLAGFDLSQTPEQRGMDIIIRKVGADRVFYDRLNATATLGVSSLRINPVWLFDFEDCPETARRYITILGARRFQTQAMGSEILDKISQEEEQAALAALQDDQRAAAPVTPEGVPQSETDVVNLMLTAAGLEPISSVDSILGRDAATALNILRSVTKETLSQRWTFNTEYGYTLSPLGSYVDGAETLYVYAQPAGLAGFRPTRNTAQLGMDLTARPSRTFAPLGTMILADRLKARDGLPVSTLKIDPVWLRDFSECPEAARRYITTAAARRFFAKTQEQQIAGYSAEDEQQALVAFHMSERQVAPVSDGGLPQTETDAVNQLLAAMGQNPIVSVDAILTPEASQALNLVRQAAREVCSEGWRFNTEHGYELLPSGTYQWTNEFAEVYTLNVFEVPEGLLSFNVTSTEWQQGERYLDLAMRPSREYLVDGKSVQLLVDRTTNRDGHYQRDAIHIDPVWMLPFGDLPEEARHLCLVLASRRFAGERAPYNRRDELLALRSMKRAHGYRDTYNIFDNLNARRIMGGRPLGPAGFYDPRATGR